MHFPTVTFAVFFAVAWPLVVAVRRWPRIRMVVLVAASGVFYAWWDWRSLWLLASLIVGNWAAAHALDRVTRRWARRAVLAAGVGGHLLVLGWFKYYGFLASSLTSALRDLGLDLHPRIVQAALPLGISFLTFASISHLLEVSRRVSPPATLLQTAAWLSFFPTLVAGPIVRPSELVPQLAAPGDGPVDSDRAFVLIGRGLAKKVVLASFLASAVADDVFAAPDRYSGLYVLVGVYAYAVQLYCDFSGYSDIAVGSALLLGLRIPENFDAPYRSRTVTEFWTRWHQTLSRWLRDFLFMPLARRSSGSTTATCAVLVFVMLLAGLWHGAAWTFVAFGAVHGIALAAERVARQRGRRTGRRKAHPSRRRRAAQQVLTFHVVCLGWVFFRAETFDQAGAVLGRIASGTLDLGGLSVLPLATIAAVLAIQHVPTAVGDRALRTLAAGPAVAKVAALGIAVTVIDVLGPGGVPPFLYFGF